MTRGQPAARRSEQREVMLRTLNPEAMDSLPSGMSNNFDLLADSVSYSQWPTLPLSPTRGQMRGSSCSFLDGSPRRDGATRNLGDSLDTLPRGTSYRLVAPGTGVESEFDLLGASSMLPATETPLLEPAIEYAADACPANVRPSLSQHHRKAHEPVRSTSITLPQPPEDTPGNIGPSYTLQFPPSSASSLQLSSGGATDAYTATQGTGSVESWSKHRERSSSPGPASLPPLPMPPSATTPRASTIGLLQAPAAHRSFRAHAEEAMAASAAQRREGSAVHRSPVSEATVVSASSESSPPWMSSGMPSSEQAPHILTPRGNPAALLRSHTSSNQFETNTNFQSCISSIVSSCTMSADENSGRMPSLAPGSGWQMKAAPAFASADKQSSSTQHDTEPGTLPASVAASANQAWSNPIFSSRSDNGVDLDTMGSDNGASALVSSYHDYDAEGECAENDQNPTNDPSRHQSLALSQTQSQALSQALESSLEPAATGDSGIVPDAICSFLDKIDDMEKRISCGWQEEQARRAQEQASLEEDAGKIQPALEHSGTAASISSRNSRQLSARSQTASPGALHIQLESSEAALGTPSQVNLALSATEVWNTQEPGSPSACETPRNWEEHALELQEALAATQLQAQQDREAFESDLRDLQKQLQHERLLRQRAAHAALDKAGSAHKDDARVKTDAATTVTTPSAEPAVDDATVLVAQAQDSVNRLEEVVSTRLENLVAGTANMKVRMEAAQDEARVLREEVQAAESRVSALEAELQEAKGQRHQDQSKSCVESTTGAFTGTPRSQPSAKTQSSDAEMNALLKQLQAADAENTELKESVSKLQAQQAALQALVDDRQGGTGTVSMFEHQKIVSQNKELQAQLQQLRMDLELLYMDEQYNTGAGGNEGRSMGIGASSDLLNPSAPTSFMSTVQRLGALLGVPETQRGSQSFMRGRSFMNTLPQLSEHSASASPENASPHHPCRDTSAASSTLLPFVDEDKTYGEQSGAVQRIRSRGHEHGSPMSVPSSPHGCPIPATQDNSMLDGPGNPAGSVMSMCLSMDRSTLTALREATADRLASTVQNQAAAIVEKEKQIAELQQRICELEEAQMQQNGNDTCASASGDENGYAWESLPPPESFKEALEQILMLQVENSRLSGKLARKLGLPGSSGVLSEGISRDKAVHDSQMADASCSVTLQKERDRRRKGAVLIKSVSQARKAMASMHVLAEAMSSVQGQGETGAISFQAESGMVADGSTWAQDAEMGVFKDMVTRALSDQVVAWQNAHTEVSRDLVAANLRVAEDAMFIEQLKAEHDRLCATIKQLTVAQTPAAREPPTPSTPGRNSSSSKGGRLSFLGRLTTPRHS